jgi:hypothetical protein
VTHSAVQTRKIKAIISENLMKGVLCCAKKLNEGGFPSPDSTPQKKYCWKPDQILPFLNDTECPVHRKPKTYTDIVTTHVTEKVSNIISRQDNLSAFVRAAIDEKIARDGL